MPSAVIYKIEYNAEKQVLSVIYNSGTRYNYKDVPEKVYKEMRASQSKGRYLNFFVKGKYAFEKVTGNERS